MTKNGLPLISTFSIVGVDTKTEEIGVAVQSKFLAVPLLRDRALPMLNQPLEFEQEGMNGFRRTIRDLVGSIFGETGAATTDIVLDQAKETTLALIRVPGLLERILRKGEQGDLYFRTDLSELTRRLERQERMTSRIVWSLLFAFSGGIGAYLHGRGDFITADTAWTATIIFGLGLLFNIVSARRLKKSAFRPPHRS